MTVWSTSNSPEAATSPQAGAGWLLEEDADPRLESERPDPPLDPQSAVCNAAPTPRTPIATHGPCNPPAWSSIRDRVAAKRPHRLPDSPANMHPASRISSSDPRSWIPRVGPRHTPLHNVDRVMPLIDDMTAPSDKPLIQLASPRVMDLWSCGWLTLTHTHNNLPSSIKTKGAIFRSRDDGRLLHCLSPPRRPLMPEINNSRLVPPLSSTTRHQPSQDRPLTLEHPSSPPEGARPSALAWKRPGHRDSGCDRSRSVST